jgi:pleiotropic regulator 1
MTRLRQGPFFRFFSPRLLHALPVLSRQRQVCRFFDWRSGNCFQQGQTVPQPGSLDSEAGIYALAFDQSGSRLVTCEADKSIKMWKEDPSASEETHPVSFRPPKDIVRRY